VGGVIGPVAVNFVAVVIDVVSVVVDFVTDVFVGFVAGGVVY
ncbi:unnamed protein product, partial [Rotaria sp. Silwood1]